MSTHASSSACRCEQDDRISQELDISQQGCSLIGGKLRVTRIERKPQVDVEDISTSDNFLICSLLILAKIDRKCSHGGWEDTGVDQCFI